MMSSFKIDFCVVGPQRTGSTWLYEVLNRYNLACLPKDVKETNFFDSNYSKGNNYYSTFFQCESGHLRGEVATTYFDNLECIHRIKEHNAHCKVIIIYRDPIERAISLYNHHKRKGRIKPSTSITESIETFPSIIEGGKYAKWISYWIQSFGESNVKVMNYHDLQKDPQKYINELLAFLDKPNIILTEEDICVVNKASSPRSFILAKLAADLSSTFRKNGLDKLVNYGKKLGLNKIYAGGTIDDIDKEEKEELNSYFNNEDFIYGR